MPRHLRLLALFATIVAPIVAAPLAAQSYTGTFTAPEGGGWVMSLVLQESGGFVTGSLFSGGLEYVVEGRRENRLATGTMVSDLGTAFFFEADRWEDELLLTLYGVDPRGEPDYGDYDEFELLEISSVVRPGGNARMAPGYRGAGNPLGGWAGPAPYGVDPLGGPLAWGYADFDPWVGTFSDGTVTLRLVGANGSYEGELDIFGAVYRVEARGGPRGLRGILETAEGRFPIAAQARTGGLLVTSGGSQYALRRYDAAFGRPGYPGPGASAGPAPTPPLPLPGRTTRRGYGYSEQHPRARDWFDRLSRRRLTGIEGLVGATGARTDLYLCADRSFALRHDRAPGSGGGAPPGTEGFWTVVSDGRIDLLLLEFRTGALEELELVRDARTGRISANGVAVRVTPETLCG